MLLRARYAGDATMHDMLLQSFECSRWNAIEDSTTHQVWSLDSLNNMDYTDLRAHADTLLNGVSDKNCSAAASDYLVRHVRWLPKQRPAIGETISRCIARRTDYLLGSKLDLGDRTLCRLIKEEALHQDSVIRSIVSFLVVKGANMRHNKNRHNSSGSSWSWITESQFQEMVFAWATCCLVCLLFLRVG